MPTFELSGPDGGTYQVDAPDERAALSAFSSLSGGAKQPQQPQGDNVGGPVEETARAFNNGLDAFKAAGPQNSDPENYSAVGGLLKTGRAIMAIPEMAGSIFTGPGMSAVGNTLEGVDKLLPVTDEQRAKYGLDSPREGAAKALMGVAPRGFSPVGAIRIGNERVGNAAIRIGDKIFTGRNHGEAYEAAVKALGYDPLDAGSGVRGANTAERKNLNGFVTSAGRFLDRSDAARIAQSANQTKSKDGLLAHQIDEPHPSATPRDELLRSAERLGVAIPRAVASDTMGVQQTGKIATNIPIGGTPLRKASQNAINQLDEAATRTEQGFGSGSPVAAGRAADDGVTDWIKNTSAARVGAQYDKVDALVDPSVVSPLTRTTLEAQKILARRNRAGITAPSEAVKRITEAASRSGMEYEGVKDLRTYIRGLLDGDSPLPADMSGGELKRIYGALTDDLRDTIHAAGGDKAVGAWERANRYAQATAQRRENLARIVGGKSDEQIFSRIASAANSGSKGDIQLLSQARRAVDNDTWDEISSAVISSLGRSPAGEFSPDRFVTAWGKLSPQAKSLLFKSTGKPQLAQALDDIAVVSQRFKTLQQFANPSGTGQTVLGGVIGGGAMIDPVTAATSIMSARIVSEILARPASAQSMAKWAKAYAAAVQSKSPGAIQNFIRASAVFAADVGNAIGAPQHVGELARQLQGAVPARSGEQQQQ